MGGQTLIEVLVALGIIGVVASALAGVVIVSLGNTQFSKSQSQASQFAQEGLEIIRQWRDSDYLAFKNTPSGTYCLADKAVSLDPNCPVKANLNNFFRSVEIVQSGCSPNVSRVNVIVAWQDGKCTSSNQFCHSVSFPTCLATENALQGL